MTERDRERDELTDRQIGYQFLWCKKEDLFILHPRFMDNLSLYQCLAEYTYQDIKRFEISRENFKLHSYKPL